MSIELYPSIAKIKRNGVYENLPGFVPETGSIATQQMIATSESSATAQYVHNKGEYFRLNDTLYQAIVKINIGDAIVVGTNCEVAVLGNDVTHIANSIAEYELGIATAPHSTGEYFMVGEILYVATDNIDIGDNISTSTNCRVAVVGDELSALKSALTADETLQPKTIKTVVSGWTNGRITSNALQTNSKYAYSDTYAYIAGNPTAYGQEVYFDDTKYEIAFCYYDSEINNPANGFGSLSSWFSSSPVKIPNARPYFRCMLKSANDIIVNGINVYWNDSENTLLVDTVLQNSSNIEELKDDFENLPTAEKLFIDDLKFTPEWESGTFSQNIGEASTNSANVKRQRMKTAVKYDFPIKISSDGTYEYVWVKYELESDVLIAKSKTSTYISEDTYIDANTYFRIAIRNAANPDTDISSVTSNTINEKLPITSNQITSLVNPNVNWCAMGDSLTEGYVSYTNNSTNPATIGSVVNKNIGWAYELARINNWNLTNIAIGGSGFIDKATASTAHPDPDETPAWYVATHTDFTPYNLVTLAYGINDWKANKTIGTLSDDPTEATPTTVLQAMKKTIEAIISSNKHCKIIVILPVNIAGYSGEFGDESTNYAIGYNQTNCGTLDDFAEAMISVCDYYGIQYIDQTHYSCVNRMNLQQCLDDGVHPNAATHDLLARELCRKITFN